MKSRWSESQARDLKGIQLLVYRSRLIGRESSLVLWGGGNTSMKLWEKDHLGRQIRVLRVKGSGSDLQSCAAQHFSPLRLEELLAALKIPTMTDEEMVDFMERCLLDPKAPRPSIETLMHAFIPFDHVDHSHADAIVSITNTRKNREIFRKIYGNELVWVPYIKPGFPLAKAVAKAMEGKTGIRGAMLEKHGLFTWGKTARESYKAMIEMVSRAERFIAASKKKRSSPLPPTKSRRAQREEIYRSIAPALRGEVSRQKRSILEWRDGEEILKFLNRPNAQEIVVRGPATPDHLLRTKRSPLFCKISKGPDEILRALKDYRRDYDRYFHQHASAKDRLLDSNPRIFLIPQVGIVTIGKDKKTAQIVADIAEHTLEVMANAEAIDRYQSLSEKDIFQMEYWPLELYKLTLAPAEKELARRIALITGAAGGIGRATALRFAEAGCHLVIGDTDAQGITAVVQEIEEKYGRDLCVGLPMDVTSEREVRTAFEKAVTTFGGLDIVVSNAGIAFSHPIDDTSLDEWEKSLAVNATGHFLVAKEALKIFKQQKIGGNLVFVSTKNVMAPGRDFGAYSASKAAEAQLARVLAIENGECGIRVNCVNPDAVFQGSKIWSSAVRRERAQAHGIPTDQLEDFYRKRNLLHTQVTPPDVAESILFLASDRSSKTTGCTITVDGGVKEAFPR